MKSIEYEAYTNTAAGASQRKIGGPSSRAIFIDTGYVSSGVRFFLHKIYCERTCNTRNRKKKNEFCQNQMVEA